MDILVKQLDEAQTLQITFQAERLISDTSVRLGTSLENAALNAANEVGPFAEIVRQTDVFWPDLEPYDNARFAPGIFPGIQDPQYIWDLPFSNGQQVFFGAATNPFQVNTGEFVIAQVTNTAFADNAFATRFLLFRQGIGGAFVQVTPQPAGLGNFLLVSGTPNNPETGLTETEPPFNWQNVRFYHTRFFITNPGVYKLVNAYQARNYLSSVPGALNPAALQFVTDLTLTFIP